MRAVTRPLGLVCLLLASSPALAEYRLNLEPGVTVTSQNAYDIHQIVMWICVVIGIVVYGVMTYSILTHTKAKGHKPATFDDNLTIEILWTVIPILILIGMAIPATSALLDMEDVSDSDMSIKVTGYQWKWHYDYVGEDVSFFSNLSTPMEQIKNQEAKGENYLLEVDNKIVVPTGKKVRFLFTSSDVIHAWWVPAFGVKKDAIPGFINESWARVDEPGIYRGQCAELCGANHGFMPIVVEAKSEEDYLAWLNEKKSAQAAAAESGNKTWTMDELMAHGEAAYNTSCAACHQVGGEGLPNVFPGLIGSAIVTGDVAKHIDVVINGVAGTGMQAFGPQLNDADLAAIITYERNAWGNNSGDMVQPSDVKAAR